MENTHPRVSASQPHHSQLSNRQIEILQKICEGKSVRDISLDLFISENTVKYHLKAMFRLLRVHNRAMLVRLALQEGYLK